MTDIYSHIARIAFILIVMYGFKFLIKGVVQSGKDIEKRKRE